VYDINGREAAESEAVLQVGAHGCIETVCKEEGLRLLVRDRHDRCAATSLVLAKGGEGRGGSLQRLLCRLFGYFCIALVPVLKRHAQHLMPLVAACLERTARIDLSMLGAHYTGLSTPPS
jgi:hypothetical protein